MKSLIVTIISYFIVPYSWACTVCFGDPTSLQTKGMNMAILTLLGIIGVTLTILAGYFLWLKKRIRVENAK